MKSLEAVECAYDGQMKQIGHIIEGDGTFPIGRWKQQVSLCHLSIKVDISPRSPVSNEHVIKGLNLVATTNPSILIAGLPNF